MWLNSDDSEGERLALKGQKAKSSASKTGTTPKKGTPVTGTAGNTVVTVSTIVASNQSPPDSTMQISPVTPPPQPRQQNVGQTIVETVASSPLKQSPDVPSPSKVGELLKKLRNEPVVASNYGNSSGLIENTSEQTPPERQIPDKRPKGR